MNVQPKNSNVFLSARARIHFSVSIRTNGFRLFRLTSVPVRANCLCKTCTMSHSPYKLFLGCRILDHFALIRADFCLFVSHWLGALHAVGGLRKTKRKKNTLSTRGCMLLVPRAREECPTHKHYTLTMSSYTFLVSVYTPVMHTARLYVHIVRTMNWLCQNTSEASAKTTENTKQYQEYHVKR